MGLKQVIQSAVGGALADQWLEIIEPDRMDDTTVFTKGVPVRKDDKRNHNRKGTADYITDGSVIHVYPNQCMLLVDGGKIVDYTAEEGYFTVDNQSAPSMMNGRFLDTLKETFNRFRYGGTTPTKQQVFCINLQEIKGIKFGTRNPINYFDNFYNAELFLRAHGTYSMKVTDPLLFYAEAVPRSAERVDIEDINQQYTFEFIEALQTAMNQLSVDGVRISHVQAKGRELSRYMQDILDEDWRKNRGMEVQAVAIASISYDEKSQELINMRNEGAMLSDASIREGYVQGSVARGIEAAGSNEAGATQSFLGMGMGMHTGGLGQMSETNRQQMQQQMQQQMNQQTEDHTHPVQDTTSDAAWVCAHCNHENVAGKFCSNCGEKRPDTNISCLNCGYTPEPNQPMPKFCPECGTAFPQKQTPEDER